MTARPVKANDLQRIVGLYDAMQADSAATAAPDSGNDTTSRGRVLIVSGPPGSGRTALLEAAAEALHDARPRPVILAGRIASAADGRASYVAWDKPDESAAKEALALLQQALALGAKLIPVLGPVIDLLAQILGTTSAARDLATRLQPQPAQTHPLAVVSKVLRAAASERPCVCVLDDADHGAGPLWRNLEFSFANDIARDLPLLLVMAIHDHEGEPGGADEADVQQLARRLEQRGLAERLSLTPFTPEDVTAWIGRADREVVEHLLHVAWGRPGLMASIWGEWTNTQTVEPATGGGRWVFVPTDVDRPPRTLDEVQSALLSRLERAVEEDLDDHVALLRCAALEGRQFTAEVVATVLERCPNDVNNVLDDVLCVPDDQGRALVEEANDGVALEIPGGSKPLWLYRFVSPWHWLALRAQLSAPERRELAGRVADALAQHYAPEVWRVARSLAELSRLAGRVEAAGRYQRMADFGGHGNDLRVEAARLLHADIADWDAWECTRAGWALHETVRELFVAGAPIPELLEYLERQCDLGVRAGNGVLQFRALISRARCEIRADDLDAAEKSAAAAVRIAHDLPHRAGEASAQLTRGMISLERRDHAAALTSLRAALALSEAVGDLRVQAGAHQGLLVVAHADEDAETMYLHARKALDCLRRAAAAPHMLAVALLDLAVAAVDVGAEDEAAEHYRAATELRDLTQTTDVKFKLGQVALKLGDRPAAQEHLESALRQANAEQDAWSIAYARAQLKILDAEV